jgi:predicted nucleic acid-binding protein
MQLNSKIIVSDTSCLILLLKIDEIGILKEMSNRVFVTSVIKDELKQDLPNWIQVLDPKDKHYQSILEIDLDKGEASAIALMLELEDAILIIDDLKGRKLAEKLGFKFSGTLGLLLKAKQIGIIKSIKPVLDKIRLTNFRFSEKLFTDILNQAKE